MTPLLGYCQITGLAESKKQIKKADPNKEESKQ